MQSRTGPRGRPDGHGEPRDNWMETAHEWIRYHCMGRKAKYRPLHTRVGPTGHDITSTRNTHTWYRDGAQT
eukprot:11207028-Lingulodinium_polyedra.AAC.1